MYINSFKGKYKVNFSEILPEVKDGVIVIDRYIKENYYNDLDLPVYIVDVNEDAKTLDQTSKLIDYLLKIGFKKNNQLIAIGGGVVQDLVSFTTSILFRGVKWSFIPTTLLSQCDSCIGSKTSINFNGYKNLLGGFHPPQNIFIWNGFLKTLSNSDIKSGIGEMLHYFLLNNKLTLSEQLTQDTDIINNIEKYLYESLNIKKIMIEKDEFDKNERNLFNYGHTFGHALESLSDYKINHGQAVTFGMNIANKIALKKELISYNKYERIKYILLKNLPNWEIDDVEKYIECLKKDKKNIDDNLTCILLTDEYGVKNQIKYDEVKEVL